MVPPDSHGISRAPCYLGYHTRRDGRFRLRDCHPLWCALPRASTNAVLYHFSSGRQTGPDGPTTPATQRLPAVTRDRFGLFRFRSPLLTESRLLSLPAGNEMFHFPAFPPHALCVQAWVTGHDSCRVSPFGNPRITARLTAPRGLSQPPTSFIGSWCQGIHRAPLLTWPQRCSRPLCSSQETDRPRRATVAAPPPRTCAGGSRPTTLEPTGRADRLCRPPCQAAPADPITWRRPCMATGAGQ